MKLIEQVRRVCVRLADEGWSQLLAAHGLNIEASDLAAELARPLPGINRGLKGFEDFSVEGLRGVEPGRPQESLLFHALAGPNVLLDVDGNPLRAFPTLRELEIVEDYVFSAAQRSIDDIRSMVGNTPLEIVVFAFEYRSASETCSRLQADVVFARTGVARTGTLEPLYDARRRGFLPESEADPFAIRVLPARYAAYLATRDRGSERHHRPMRAQPGDSSREFWIPVHKLFPGRECLRDITLGVEYAAFHLNEKIRRTHVRLGVKVPPTTPPYRFSTGIASLASSSKFGRGVLVPDPHQRLVEPARTKAGKLVTYRVPKNGKNTFAAFEAGTDKHYRPYPEYVHARTEVRNGELIDLNEDATHPDVRARVAEGGYDALHYVDHTGDGYVQVKVTGLGGAGIPPTAHAAYSLVTAPDFFPTCDQRELTEWTSSNAISATLQRAIWSVAPETLCDQRFAANLQLPGSPFQADEVTMTALVPLFGPPPLSRAEPPRTESLRHAHLPDDAAGVFEPGWDVSVDRLPTPPHTPHLAAYGLGSPFPEDVILCSALSAFWPAVAPDATRTMSPPPSRDLRSTTVPLTDEEIGRDGNLPWDGIRGPEVIFIAGDPVADYADFLHSDYVRSAIEGKFTMRLTARIGPWPWHWCTRPSATAAPTGCSCRSRRSRQRRPRQKPRNGTRRRPCRRRHISSTCFGTRSRRHRPSTFAASACASGRGISCSAIR
jgi:hypothetical protein